MTLLETAAVAFAMFSAVPVPQPVWNEKNMRYALCAFPLVGVVCGLAWWGWAALAARLSFPLLLRAAGLCLAPVLVTGGIHLDGYADTCDALASCAAPEKKQEILKDPHCGAFAVISPVHLFYGLSGPVRGGGLHAPGCAVHGAGLCAGAGAFAAMRSRRSLWQRTRALPIPLQRERTARLCAARCLYWCALAAAGMAAAGGMTGAAMALAAVLVFLRYRAVAQKQFGGISGDLAGWFLQKAELWMLAALAACQPAVGGSGDDLHHRPAVQRESGRQAPSCCWAGAGRSWRSALSGTCRSWPRAAADLAAVGAAAARNEPVVIATEVGGGVVPVADPAERAAREAAGRLGCLLAQRARRRGAGVLRDSRPCLKGAPGT